MGYGESRSPGECPKQSRSKELDVSIGFLPDCEIAYSPSQAI